MTPRRLAVLALSSAALACGGSTTPPPVTQASVQITSPVDGQRVVGSRTLAVQGTAAGTGVTAVEVSLNGGLGVSAPVANGAFSATVTLGDQANAITVTAAGPKGTATAGPVNVFYPWLSLASSQSAVLVVGQADFVSAGPNGASGIVGADGVDSPYGDAAWDGTWLYLPDYANSRVLVYSGFPAANGAAASLVMGEPDMLSNGGGTGPDLLSFPETVRASGGMLAVDDSGNNRALVYLPSAPGSLSAVAVGAPDLVSVGTGGCSQTELANPESVFLVGTRLVVADSLNNRVLVWNAIPAASGAPADLVIGQADFTSCGANGASGTPGATTLSYPSDAWSDGTRLFVADQSNNRVLVWNAFPTANGAPADLVLGQPDFATVAPATTAGGMSSPSCLSSNGNQLFVSDSGNNRVLLWNAMPAASSAPADAALGQADLVSGGLAASPSASTLSYPYGVTALDGALLVTDNGNNRYLVYR